MVQPVLPKFDVLKVFFMKKFLLLLVVGGVLTSDTAAQFTRYLVKLKNKAGTPYTFTNPSAYLSARAIALRYESIASS